MNRVLHLKGGPFYAEGRCTRCGKRILDYPAGSVGLEFDRRINEYHDFGVPMGASQGVFWFGADCARVLRQRAQEALRRLA